MVQTHRGYRIRAQSWRIANLSHLFNTGVSAAELISASHQPNQNMPKVIAISVYVDNLDKAVAFYRDALGFAEQARPVPFIVELAHEGAALVLCQAETAASSGYPNRAGIVIGVMAPDLTAAVKRVTSAGYTPVHNEPQEYPGGKYVAVADPAGNVVELISPE
jgi:predicted enzyme related to lactoylglutathione lyase